MKVTVGFGRRGVLASCWMVLAAALTVGPHCKSASAALVIELDHEFSGATPPAGDGPWLRATFTNGKPGAVNLLLEAINLSGTEFVKGWYFNLDPSLDPRKLTFSVGDKTGSFATPTISSGQSSVSKAAGSGDYDIRLAFSTVGGSTLGGRRDRRFNAGDSLAVTITGPESLTASSFDFPSVHRSAGKTGFVSAAHVLGIGRNGDDSGWVAPAVPVPEPSSLAVWTALGLIFGGVGFRRRPPRANPSVG